MPPRLRRPIGLALAALAGAAVTATPLAAHQTNPAASKAPETTVEGVTVRGQKADPLVDRTTRFVRSHLPTSRFEQYARFRDPVCVKVQGLPPEYDAFIAKRVISLANEVRAPVAKAATCTPNVNVVFSTQPQALLSDIAKRRKVLFGFAWAAEMKQMSTFSRPIQSWYLTRTVGSDGQNVLELNDGPSFTPAETIRKDDGPVSTGTSVQGRAGSRLGNELSSELVHSLIIADAAKVAGEKIDAVADYVAVLALSRWRGLEHCSSASTVLNLMADGCTEDERVQAATPEDVAILSGLYAVDPRESGTQQRASIASAVRKAGEQEARRP